ncbi:MAG: class I SAM-dependent methyltransferase, partial [Senegalia sp. (in: firmicutes)]
MNNNEKIKNRYNRVSKIYDIIESPMENMAMGKWREKLIERIEGKKVLEIGVGTGKNLSYYSDDLEVIGIDFSTNMLEKARERIKNKENIKLIEMDAQNMEFPDNT